MSHGTCATSVLATEHDYFSTILSLHESLDLKVRLPVITTVVTTVITTVVTTVITTVVITSTPLPLTQHFMQVGFDCN